jgi:predicted transport protein
MDTGSIYLWDKSMSDIKLFNISNGSVQELQGTSIAIEKTLQTLIESHLEAFLGVRFLVSEHSTGKTHGGRIDTLGVDENGSPVIIEYKRALNENVINQGLFYLDWLMDHKGEFELLVLKKLGNGAADSIDWSAPRLLCIASDFTKYDEHAVQQINRNIELIRYRRYGNELVLFELVNATTAQLQPDASTSTSDNGLKHKGVTTYKTVTELLEQSPSDTKDRFEALKAFLIALGDDVQLKVLKYYFAFRRIKNFACVEVHPQSMRILLFVKVDPTTIQLEKGFTRDVRNIGHYGTGELEITIQNDDDLERAKRLILKSYEAS